MNWQEAAEYFARKRDTLIWGLKDNRDETRQAHDAYNEAIAALCGPQPDPITGLVPCGCGGKAAPMKFNDGFADFERVWCIECKIEVTRVENGAKEAWNRAMGWKGGAELYEEAHDERD